ncbi:DUF4190 domain-containing protein [Bifidobacterium sp. ESL0728]|uniref:DUF4190 domain-containing protein n=1 Tax=Bifidobacterium sp. ESL0728 TaxID=2983220 RepID=UPI0023F9AA14|nr:DUF4190 domain-containing protein [Bifidobacterium sp. ESL0728]WEV59508.1 DUF4190 domain-containing protein [Bifidobacterium sp. ESL0728]
MTDNDFNANPQQGQPPYQYGDAGQQTGPQAPQAPYQYAGSDQQMPNYQPYGSVPPSGPGPMPPAAGPSQMPPMGPQGYYYPPAPNQKWNTLCVIGFILSFFVPIIGLALSIVAMVQINRSGEKSKGMAVAGIAIGAVLTILDIIVVIALVSAFGYAFNHIDSDDEDCHGSDCNSDPYDDDDDPDDDNEDTNYTYYLYDFELQTADNTI